MSFADKNLPGIKEILRVIPEDVLIKLSADTNVDYCAKLLTGKLMFYLLLFGLLKLDRLSQRTLCDAYGSSLFKTLFGIEGNRQFRTAPFLIVFPVLILISSVYLMSIFINYYPVCIPQKRLKVLVYKGLIVPM